MRTRPVLGLILAAAVLAGCGNSRTPIRDYSSPLAPSSFSPLSLDAGAVSLNAPGDWVISRSHTPLLATISSGSAIVAVWRFARRGPVPSTNAELRGALSSLLTLSRGRDRRLRLIRTKISAVRGLPAIELDTFQSIGGQPRRVRSIHVFTGGWETVLEQYAPPGLFHQVDHATFSPIKRSLRVSAT